MGENTFDYAYDPIGNRMSEIRSLSSVVSTNLYTANELNQYTAISNSIPVSPTYDDDGNMLTFGDPPSHGYGGTSWTFTWDGENRLIAVASNSVTVVQNQYDYMSRRIMKATATETNTYLYDSWNMIREIKTPNNQSPITNNFIWGLDLSQSLQGAGGVGGLLSVVSGGTTSVSSVFFPAYDANGNITDYTDANGTIVAHYEYDPFGNISAQSGSMTDDFVYRFSTKYTDDETGLVYYGYRYYNPELGRWLNRDPLQEAGGINLYGFVGNYPLGNLDYLGLSFWDYFYDGVRVVSGAFTIAAGGAIAAGASWTGVGAVGGAALVVIGVDQLHYGAANIVSRAQGRGAHPGTGIQTTYRFVSRQITGVDGSGLEVRLDEFYAAAEIASAWGAVRVRPKI